MSKRASRRANKYYKMKERILKGDSNLNPDDVDKIWCKINNIEKVHSRIKKPSKKKKEKKVVMISKDKKPTTKVGGEYKDRNTPW